MCFPCSSAGKKSACNAGDPSSTPGSRRSPGEGIGYPFQYSWASLVAQTVKNLLVMRETWVQSMGWEDPLVEGRATHSSILAWGILMDRGTWQATVHGVSRSLTQLSDYSTALNISVQSLSRVWLFATPWIAARQASLSITNSKVHSDSRLSSQWCHPAISSSIKLIYLC